MQRYRAPHAMLSIAILVSLFFTLVASVAQAQIESPNNLRDRKNAGPDPIPGLTDAQFFDFKRGLGFFREKIQIDEGLGPAFNAQSCYSCHSNPLGGISKRNHAIETRFARIDNGIFDPLESLGGTGLQARAISPECSEVVPAEANVVIKRMTTSTMGAGLVEAIPDQQIIDRAAAQLAENPAMAGRVAYVTSPSTGQTHVGRFGWKNQHALILDFTGEAMVAEMGFTNELFPQDDPPNGDHALLAQCDTAPDPEDTEDLLNKLTIFMRFLNVPPEPRTNPTVEQGKALFHEIGCAFCHSSSYTTESTIAALDGKSVEVYSDFLLHDIGTGDGIEQGDAKGNEFRTTPLFLDTKAPYFHDGRARKLDDVVDQHRVQALSAREAYFALTKKERKAIQKFLKFR